MYLEHITHPRNIKEIPINNLCILADETREALISKLSNTGGHVGSNLGVVELTVALHYVFDSPHDKIVWDVSHQCYAHKILTGRKDAYLDPVCYNNVTGYTNPTESEHDFFTVGHTATSVSLALGLAKARDISGKSENIIAVIGDGALSGGEAYEALNYAGEYKNNLIIILNDNEQSIGENHGGLYRILAELRQSNGESPNNLFKSLGLDYKYLDDGHNIPKLVELFESAKNSNCPIVLHIRTVKGKGLPFAENEKEKWHSSAPFNAQDGTPKNGYPVYDTTIHDSLTELMTRDEKSVVLTAGTPRAMGFVGEDRENRIASGRFVDVGIAEENAVAMSSGIATYGGTAVFGVYAPFLQRAYDQLSHDLCLNNSPATILVLLPGVYGMKSNTHLGLCDIQMISHIPNIVYLAPTYKEEYLQMLKYATTQKNHPTAIRVPVRFLECGRKDTTDYSVINKAKILKKGSKIAILAIGLLVPKALEIAETYKQLSGETITVINPIYLTGIDTQLLQDLKSDHSLIITMEDGELDGGYGQRIASFYGTSSMKVKNLGISKEFHSDFNAEELLAENGICTEKIIEYINSHKEF